MNNENVEFLKLIVSNTQESIFLVNIHHVILFSNLLSNDFIGSNILSYISKYHTKRFEQGIKDVVFSKKSLNMEFKAKFSDERLTWFNGRVSPIMKDNEDKSLLIFISDVSEKRNKILKEKDTKRKRLMKANERINMLEKMIELLDVKKNIRYKEYIISIDEFINNPFYKKIKVEDIKIIDD